ncbi:MAG: hypothetical protein QM811_12420 [Pirellulales bacterium]
MNDELVILLHGFAAKRVFLKPQGVRLSKTGFRVEAWTYPSVFTWIPVIAARLSVELRSRFAQEARIHFV